MGRPDSTAARSLRRESKGGQPRRESGRRRGLHADV